MQIRSGQELNDTEHLVDIDQKYNALLTIIVLR